MMTDAIIERAEILIQQKKYPEAEQMLKNALASAPHDVYALTLLAEVYLQLDQADRALELSQNALGLAPDLPHLYDVQARALMHRDRYDEAEASIARAVELDPSQAEYPATWAWLKLDRKQYAEALRLANQALELNPENLLALNLRSTAQLKLNDQSGSFATIAGALRHDPNNAFTHANYGWGLLENGQPKQALEHFKEALKIDPSFELAQAGMAEALKAHNWMYRWYLKYSFWLGNLTSKYQWGVIIGFYLLSRVARAVPALTPLAILLAVVAFSTWIIRPIGNLLLRFNKYGRHLLDQEEIRSSNFVAASLGLGLVGGLLFLGFGHPGFLVWGTFGLAMMLPCGSLFAKTKSRWLLPAFTAGLAVVGLGAIALTFATGVPFNILAGIFLLGFVGFQWVANFLTISKQNK
ncbi:MAG: tetratricopeptide repeat protein [Bernardetiaceae bacterium]|nr:tetratricopeptide repeat protein [Bernardetiaceae bacterium]